VSLRLGGNVEVRRALSLGLALGADDAHVRIIPLHPIIGK
jgi:hypothetical protein